MNISSKRFIVKSDGMGGASIRDRNAPFHCHNCAVSDLPSVNQMALMNERDFDNALNNVIYGDTP